MKISTNELLQEYKGRAGEKNNEERKDRIDSSFKYWRKWA